MLECPVILREYPFCHGEKTIINQPQTIGWHSFNHFFIIIIIIRQRFSLRFIFYKISDLVSLKGVKPASKPGVASDSHAEMLLRRSSRWNSGSKPVLHPRKRKRKGRFSKNNNKRSHLWRPNHSSNRANGRAVCSDNLIWVTAAGGKSLPFLGRKKKKRTRRFLSVPLSMRHVCLTVIPQAVDSHKDDTKQNTTFLPACHRLLQRGRCRFDELCPPLPGRNPWPVKIHTSHTRRRTHAHTHMHVCTRNHPCTHAFMH